MSDLDAAIDAFRTFCNEEDKWKLAKEQDGVKVHTRTVEGSSLSIARGVVTVKASLQKCLDLAMAAEKRASWDKIIKEARKVRDTDDGHVIFYLQSVAKWPASARDFLIDLYIKRFDDHSVVAYGKCPEKEEVEPVKGVVRGKCISSGYIFVPNADDTATTITYVMQLDMGGWLPASIVNMVMVDEPLCLTQFRNILEKEAAEAK